MSTPERGHELKAEVGLLIMVFVWAANYSLAKFCISVLNIFVFNGIRYLCASLLLLAIFLARSHWTPVNRADWKRLLEAGFIANVLYQIAFIIGLNMTTAGNSAVLLSTAPLWTVMIHSFMRRETVRPKIWAGMILSFIGVVMIVTGSGTKLEVGGKEMLGDIISLAAAVLWALNTNLQKPLLSKYSAMQLALVMISIGGVGLSIIAIPAAMQTRWAAIGWEYYAGAVVSGALSIGIANVIWSYGVKHLGPGRTGNFSNLTPVAAILLSFIFLHEQLAAVQLAGAGLTILGVWVVRH